MPTQIITPQARSRPSSINEQADKVLLTDGMSLRTVHFFRDAPASVGLRPRAGMLAKVCKIESGKSFDQEHVPIISDAVREFLQKPLIARMSTVDPNGYPHTVPVWFTLDGDDIVIISARETRKVGHILANARGAVTIGGDPGDGGGYLIKGEFSVEADPVDAWVREFVSRYEAPEQAETDIAAWADLDTIALRLKPRVILKVM